MSDTRRAEQQRAAAALVAAWPLPTREQRAALAILLRPVVHPAPTDGQKAA